MDSFWNNWTNAKSTQELISKNVINQRWRFGKNDNLESVLKDQLTFILFSNRRCKYTDNEVKLLEQMAKTCSYFIKNNLCDSDTFVSIIYVCVKTNSDPPNNTLVPILRLNYPYGGVENIHFIDHTGRVYNTWGDFRSDNIFRGYTICYPETGEYTDNFEVSFGDWENCTKYIHSDDLLKVEFSMRNQPTGVEQTGVEQTGVEQIEVLEVINMSRGFITNLDSEHSNVFKMKFIKLMYKYTIDSTFVNTIINCLRDQCNEEKAEIFDVLLNGFRCVTGQFREHLGNVYFIINIARIWQQSSSFEKLKLVRNKQLLHVKCTSQGTIIKHTKSENSDVGFTFDAKALVQIDEEFKDLTKDYLLHKYRWITDKTILIEMQEICELLKCPSIFSFTLNGNQIFNNIRPREIRTLHRVLLADIKKKLRKDYLNIGMEVVRLMDCQDVHEFCALYELFVIYVRKTYENNVLEFLLDKKRKHDLILEMKKVIEKCAHEMKGKFKFGKLSAATHFFKHSSDIDCFNTEQKYFSLANEMTSKEDVPFHWSQDGSAKRYKFHKNLKDKEKIKLLAVKCIQENGAATIITLHKREIDNPNVSGST
ncbi:uncharacterized protein LOC131949840 [Physella acuta]|uniref:uncharacterized protein LOC131949840 n=1 Tax=Physella acuta TaxID=109671 RepID=UPI0027DE0360|nr:uncharacterized protein LOC131949840 [Physella acuta]